MCCALQPPCSLGQVNPYCLIKESCYTYSFKVNYSSILSSLWGLINWDLLSKLLHLFHILRARCFFTAVRLPAISSSFHTDGYFHRYPFCLCCFTVWINKFKFAGGPWILWSVFRNICLKTKDEPGIFLTNSTCRHQPHAIQLVIPSSSI